MSGACSGWVLANGPRPDDIDRDGNAYGLPRARCCRLVLAPVADAANAQGEHSHPGLDAIVEASLYSRRQVIACLDFMVAEGWLEVQRKGGGRGRATEYRVTMNVPAHSERNGAEPDDETVQPDQLNGAQTVQNRPRNSAVAAPSTGHDARANVVTTHNGTTTPTPAAHGEHREQAVAVLSSSTPEGTETRSARPARSRSSARGSRTATPTPSPEMLPGTEVPIDPDAADRRRTADERQAEWERVDRLIAARVDAGLAVVGSPAEVRTKVRAVLRGAVRSGRPDAEIDAAMVGAYAMTLASVEGALNASARPRPRRVSSACSDPSEPLQLRRGRTRAAADA